jgi:aminopeptidase N
VNTTLGETQVNSYYLPGYRASGEQALQIAADSLEVFNTRFGPYPYRELDVIAAPMRGALGVEFPGIILIGLHLYDEPERPEFAVTIAHEVAHQWWYSTVGNDVFDEPWLDEALTTYSSGLYYEEKLGSTYQAGLESYWQDRYDRLLEQGLDDLVTESLSHFEHQAGPAAYGGVVYVKGALFFKALRDEIGDPAFFQALQNYYQTHLFGIARTPDLLDAFETAAGRDLSGFYQSWLYSKQ